KARELINSSRLQVGLSGGAALLTGKHNLNAFEEEKRKEAVSVALSSYDEAKEMGARFFAVISGPHPAEGRKEAMRLLVKSLKEIGAYARERGAIPLFLETFDWDIDKCCLIGPSSDALQIAREVAQEIPQFALMLDLSHLPLLREDPGESVRLLAGWIGRVHLGNCVLSDRSHPAYGDQHPPFGIRGGANDVEEVAQFFRALLEVGYLREGRRPFISLEVKPRPGEDPDAVLAGSKRVLLEAWAKA
ncbi:MAG: TIM barrel protein, partial [candidate division NC10 bacterium]|nr:TIM barrel protein [candidate division NC10 bacterium]